MTHKIINGIIMLLSILNAKAGTTQLEIYPAPNEIEASPEFQLQVNGEKVFVYHNRCASYASFSFKGTVEIKVSFNSPVYHFDIRPNSRKIVGELYRNQITFTLTQPENLSVEINKNIKRPLFIFANPLETEIPDKNDYNVIFFEKGKVHYPGEVKVESNKTVYIEGGAVVRGHFMTDKGVNITIKGRGIIDNFHYAKGQHRPLEINQCNKVLLEGIIFADSRNWTCAAIGSTNITYDNIKIISDNDWDDGIDIVGSKNVVVKNCFIRTKDDCIAVKAGIGYYVKFDNSIDVDNIVVENCVLWNGIWGNALEIGFETRTDSIKNVTFRNIDIIHTEGPEGTFTIHNGDRAVVKNILYENIWVEDAQGWLIDFRVLLSSYSKDTQRGKIEAVRFNNIWVEGEHYPASQILGFNDVFNIKNVTLENFYIHRNKINSTYNGMISVIHTELLNFK